MTTGYMYLCEHDFEPTEKPDEHWRDGRVSWQHCPICDLEYMVFYPEHCEPFGWVMRDTEIQEFEAQKQE